MTILVSCTGKFCHEQGIFQNTQAATRGVLKNFTKFTGKHLCQSLFFNKFAGLRPATLLKKAPTQVFFCELYEIFKNTFFASDCFSKYESLYMIAAVHSCLIKSCSENIWKISRSISASDCKFR